MLRILSLCSLAVVVLGQTHVGLPDGRQQRKPFIPPVTADVDKNRKTIDADFPSGWNFKDARGRMVRPRPENVHLQAERERVELKLRNQGGTGVAGAKDGFAQAIAPDNAKSRASGTLFQEGQKGPVRGGLAQAGNHRGVMRLSEDPNRKHANFTSGNHQIDTRINPVKGQEHTYANFTAKGRPVNVDLKPTQMGRTQQDGNFGYNDGRQNRRFDYAVSNNGRNTGRAKLTQTQGSGPFLGRNTQYWECTTTEGGDTICVDDRGKPAGKVTYNRRGETVVFDENNRPIGRGQARKINDQKYIVTANNGLFTAKTDKIIWEDCFDRTAAKAGTGTHFKNSKVKVENPSFKYNSQRDSDGSTIFNWPDCFEMCADITLPRGVAMKRVAWELVMHVLPMGKYDCTDPGTCPSTRNCYYCNLCAKSKSLDILENTDGNACTVGTGKQRICQTVCPTPEGTQYEMCGGFERHLIGNDYYKYNGTINAEIRMWLRPDSEDGLRDEFERNKNNPAFKTLWTVGYKAWAAQSGQNVFNTRTPEDYVLQQWFLETNGKEQLIGCQAAVVDYSLGGEKVNPNIAVDWFAQIGNDRKFQIFAEDKCDAWKQQQREEYAASRTDYERRNPGPSTGDIAGNLWNKFTGRGGGGNRGGNTGGSSGGNTGGGGRGGSTNPLGQVLGGLTGGNTGSNTGGGGGSNPLGSVLGGLSQITGGGGSNTGGGGGGGILGRLGGLFGGRG